MTRPWRPILDGAERDRALARVDRIAAALLAHVGEAADDKPFGALRVGTATVDSAGIAAGVAGAALFFAYRELAGQAGDDDRAALDWLLERAGAMLADNPMDLGLIGGFPGIAWLYDHLDDLAEGGGDDGEDDNAAVDQVLLELLRGGPWRRDYDLISGLTGLGIYGLARASRGAGPEIVEAVIAQLAATAERSDADTTWHTAPQLLPEVQREHAPDGYYNLGLAHGVPGPIGVLAEAVLRGRRAGPAAELLGGAVRWLRRQELPPPAIGRYATWRFDGYEPVPARAAWCYGDPGVAAVLYKAGVALGDDELRSHAAALARQAVARSGAASGVSDAGLCHGAAGLAQISMRFAHATGEPAFVTEARRWLAWMLDDDRAGGFAGVMACRPGDTTPYAADGSLLTGAIGVGLTLLAATTAIEPGWDQLLLVDLA